MTSLQRASASPALSGGTGAAIRMQKPTLRTAAKGFALLIVVVASVYFLFEVVRHFSTIPSIEWNALTLSVMLLSLLLMLFVIFLGGVMWYLLLQDQGANVTPRVAIEIVALSQVAKYLPGNMGHILGQMTLATAAGIPIGVALSTILISTLWLLAIGLGVGVLAFLFFMDAASTVDIPIPGTPWLVLLGLVLAGLPWFGVLFLNRYLPGLSRRLGGGKLIAKPRLGTALALGIGFLVCFLIFGIILKLHAQFLFGISEGDLITLTVLFTAAWVAGYVVPGAPGGLGVREALMVVLLSPVVGAGTAVGLGITLRLITLAGDGAAFVLGAMAKRFA